MQNIAKSGKMRSDLGIGPGCLPPRGSMWWMCGPDMQSFVMIVTNNN